MFPVVELSHELVSLRTVISAGTAMAYILDLVVLGHNCSCMLEALEVECCISVAGTARYIAELL